MERIVAAHDGEEGTREEVAQRFKVSLGMVRKLLAQRSRTGDLRARYRYCERKAKLQPEQGARLKALVRQEPDLTLAELKQRLELSCSIRAIHWVLARLGLTYKTRRSMRPSKTVLTSPRRAGYGGAARAGSTRPGWSSPRRVRRRRPI